MRQPTPLTVSFDYAVTARSCADLRGWAAQWQALGSRVLGSVAPGTAWLVSTRFLVPVVTRAGGFGDERALADLLWGTLRS